MVLEPLGPFQLTRGDPEHLSGRAGPAHQGQLEVRVGRRGAAAGLHFEDAEGGLAAKAAPGWLLPM